MLVLTPDSEIDVNMHCTRANADGSFAISSQSTATYTKLPRRSKVPSELPSAPYESGSSFARFSATTECSSSEGRLPAQCMAISDVRVPTALSVAGDTAADKSC